MIRSKLKRWPVLLLAACLPHFLQAQSQVAPRKVVLLIGDGMGLTQISAAMSRYEGQNAFMRFPFIGLSKTSSARHYITDSGAGATAFAIGKKTYNNAIGVNADTLPMPTLFELAKKNKMATGVVVTSSIQHATPASFYAHVKHRKMYDSISVFLLDGNCDIAIGGGSDFISRRTDKRNLVSELSEKGFEVTTDSVYHPVTKNRYIQLLAPDALPSIEKGRGDYLKHASLDAIRNLNKNPAGYFLMIEGSQIDWGGHDNDYSYMSSELHDFNEVINAVLDLAAKDKEMLVIVTADHETGGLTLNEHDDRMKFSPRFSTKDHTGVMVPVFAFGAGAQNFSGMYENTEIFHKLVKLLHF